MLISLIECINKKEKAVHNNLLEVAIISVFETTIR